jgi:hypothetical protein
MFHLRNWTKVSNWLNVKCDILEKLLSYKKLAQDIKYVSHEDLSSTVTFSRNICRCGMLVSRDQSLAFFGNPLPHPTQHLIYFCHRIRHLHALNVSLSFRSAFICYWNLKFTIGLSDRTVPITSFAHKVFCLLFLCSARDSLDDNDSLNFYNSYYTAAFLIYFPVLHIIVNRGTSVSPVSDYGWTIGVRSPTEAEDFSSSLCVQSGSGSHLASCSMGAGGLFPGGKARPGRDADHSPPSSAEVKNE